MLGERIYQPTDELDKTNPPQGTKRTASDAKLDILESVIRNANESKIKEVNIQFSNDDDLETSKMTITIE